MKCKSILIHDPNSRNRTHLRSLLSLNGYAVLEAANEHHAEVICQDPACAVDLVVADASSCLTTRCWEWFPERPVIAVGTSADRIEFPASAQVTHLRESFNSELLLAEIECALGIPLIKTKILIVDDNESLRNLLAEMLEHVGYQVSASDSYQALEHFKTLKADLVLTELVMSGVEGLQLIQELRKIDDEVNVVAMGFGARADTYLKAARLLGAKAILKKPFSVDDLLKVISELVGPPRAEFPVPPEAKIN